MKKNVFGLIIIFVVAIITTINVNLNSKGNDLPSVTLGGVEALAWEWWDSLVYNCETEECYITIDFIFASWTNYGKTQVCRTGSENAHCWECAGCDAPLF